MTERDGLERRRLLGALGLGATAAIAGCLGGGTEGNGNGTGSEDGDRAQVYEPSFSLADGEEPPLRYDSERLRSQRCDVCGMPINKYDGKSQLIHENGQVAVFDFPGCLFAYSVSSTPDSPVDRAWTTDEATGDHYIDAMDAHYVLISDKEAASDPMGIEPRPFANREDAISFIESWAAEDLSPEEDMIVGLDEVDMEIAKIYRKNRLPDE